MLESGLHHGRAIRRWPVTLAAVVALAGTAPAVWCITRTPMSRCEREVRHGDRERGVELCLDSFARTGNERDLSWAAKGYMYLGDMPHAEALARRLVGGQLPGDAYQILSYVTLRRGVPAEARRHAMVALAAHVAVGDEAGQAGDRFVRSLAELAEGDFRAALVAADQALALARQLHDVHMEVSVSFARGDALRRLGDHQGAIDTLTSAVDRATAPCDVAWAHLKRALARLEAAQDDLVPTDLDAAAQANRRCANSDVASSVLQNEAWLLRATDPAGALARLDELARSDGEQVDTSLLRAYVAADRGEHAQAWRYLDRAAALTPSDADWPWMVERARAELAELEGGPSSDARAEQHYRRTIAMIAALRSNARARSAYFVSSHRSPYDGLIALLARQGRWRDVLAVVLELDASDMLRATADEAPSYEHAPRQVGAPGSAPAPSVDQVLAAWRSRDLVILIARSKRRIGHLSGARSTASNERVYRLQITDGQVSGQDVGDAMPVAAAAAELWAAPGNLAAARALGRVIVPPDPTDRVLDVLAIGPLGRVPLAALRDDDGALVIARRPLARVLALRATTPAAPGDGPPVIIANPTGDLRDAADEGEVVAAALGPRAQLSGFRTSSPATRARLFAARDASLWHIAGHVSALGRWRALQLADGDVTPADILQHRLAPRIAVLAGCGSAAAMDEEGWGSIAAALLESGTSTVLATDRSIADAGSLVMIRALYAQPGWDTDPARALAKVQQALASGATAPGRDAISPQLWAAFSVLRRPPVIAGDESSPPRSNE